MNIYKDESNLLQSVKLQFASEACSASGKTKLAPQQQIQNESFDFSSNDLTKSQGRTQVLFRPPSSNENTFGEICQIEG